MKPPSPRTEALAAEIANLAALRREQLQARWRELYRTEPPKKISRDLMIRAIAYRLQENAYGGLKPATRRVLAKVAEDAAARRPIRIAPERTLKPGTVLLRDWHGVQHQVTVLESAIMFQKKQYKSLSEVARKITGTRWSGPLFFGLKSTDEEATDGAR
ncbi:MAG: DUF2924 domain-containing protein [Candidatus Binatus sp.]|uniref:DUF2924 domain-containing protein n=1 Tax=Candidatus Binatus sp. TaxID=2811406 RepID=UPI00271CDC24|nr:DUF2924 domain-containing protein [Candidatus Binatus sp.]MDO8433860.1 DUF2924 domain-containing protein [Candidatus Binatus sp.]